MQYLQFVAVPKSNNPEANEIGGALVGCWIKDRTKQEAQSIASILIEDNGWIPSRLEKHVQVQPTGLEDVSKAKEYFDQALIEGESIVFFTYPKDAKE